MGLLSWIVNDLGLVVLTALVAGLTAYLVYAMLYPERI
jgi:K+-transporting ATPase KdpF subunit